MEEIRVFIEDIISSFGLTGNAVLIVRHGVLIIIAILLSWLSDFLCRRLIIPVVDRITRRTSTKWDDVLLGKRVITAACHIVPAIMIWTLLPMIFYQYPAVQEILKRLTAIYISLATLRLFLTFISSLKLLDNGKRSSMQQYLISFCGVLRIVAIFIAAIVVIAIILGKNPMALLTGLGATSAILMLVFKDTIEGLVAGIRLTSADMLHVGDWITVSSVGADGTVIEMTLTTVKIQNFDNTIVTVSPTTLVNGSFKNWKGMQAAEGRRVARTLFLDTHSIHFADDKQTTTNIEKFRLAVEDYLSHHKKVNTTMLYMVRQKEATQGGLPLEIYFFLKDKEWKTYEHEMAAIMEHIYAMVPAYGLEVYQSAATLPQS